MPAWVNQAYQEYSQRLTRDCRLVLKEVPAIKRTKNADLDKIKAQESQKLLDLIPAGDRVIALEVGGRAWSTEQLSIELSQWLRSGQNHCLLIGGPEGLDEPCRQRADQLWSLSPLTLPHPMVRIIVAEQLFRAWSILNNHPYHR